MPSSVTRFFAYEHLPENLQRISKPFGDLARDMDALLPSGPEKTWGLRLLLQAKDALVRAALDGVNEPKQADAPAQPSTEVQTEGWVAVLRPSKGTKLPRDL